MPSQSTLLPCLLLYLPMYDLYITALALLWPPRVGAEIPTISPLTADRGHRHDLLYDPTHHIFALYSTVLGRPWIEALKSKSQVNQKATRERRFCPLLCTRAFDHRQLLAGYYCGRCDSEIFPWPGPARSRCCFAFYFRSRCGCRAALRTPSGSTSVL
ncbi:hypothetical protein EDB92DRAFT_1907654, partial [Lactarius akahatsu]